MKTLSKAVAIASLMTAGVMTSTAANAEVSFNASLVSDYVFRGFSFSDNGPALQGGADYSHDSGAYVGTWLSNYESEQDDGSLETDVEYDIYAGYWMEAGDLEIDLGLATYNYGEGGYDTTEAYAVVTRGAVSASVYRDIDAYNTTHLAVAYAAELPADLALDLSAGYLIDGEVDGEDYWGDDIVDLSASLGKSFDMVDVSLTVTHIDYEFAADIGVDETLVFLTAGTEF